MRMKTLGRSWSIKKLTPQCVNLNLFVVLCSWNAGTEATVTPRWSQYCLSLQRWKWYHYINILSAHCVKKRWSLLQYSPHSCQSVSDSLQLDLVFCRSFQHIAASKINRRVPNGSLAKKTSTSAARFPMKDDRRTKTRKKNIGIV